MLLPKRATTLLVSKATPILSLAYRFLPSKIESLVLDHMINTLSKEFIEHNELEFMLNKIVKVAIPEMNVSWMFTKSSEEDYKKERLVLIKDRHQKADVTFSGTLNAMILMASQKVDPDTLFFNRELIITGDTNLGLEIKNLIDQFDISLLGLPIKKSLDAWSHSILEVKNENAQRSVC